MIPVRKLLFACYCVYLVPLVAATQSSVGSAFTLRQLFREWRQFEAPPLLNGAPDYTIAAFERRKPAFVQLQSRLQQMDTTGWPMKERVDWTLLWAEMNGYDFNQRVLKPWERDPAFYKCVYTAQSDVPAHEGPAHHGITELWTYKFPLNIEGSQRLTRDLAIIPPLYDQARTNLTGNARDLWITGIRDIKTQVKDLEGMKGLPGVANDTRLLSAIGNAIAATERFATWLEAEAPAKTGPSGIGKEQYTWYQQNVHLVPLTWDDEVMLLERELNRAWTALKLEEHHNRNLPPLEDANSPGAYQALAEASVQKMITFLSKQDIVTVKPYFEPALRAQMGKFVPREQRNFFYIGEHYSPLPLYSHFYHWFELARIELEPHPDTIRRGALLYNIWDSRSEGLATAVEEIFLQAGLYDDNPRAKEIVYIMLAQRAARGLGSLYAHANEMTMEEAGGIHAEFTPRGWMKTEPSLRIFEQHLYLRQPGYGTSYITGKYLLEKALAAYAKQKENENQPFRYKDFMDSINAIGCIPVSLAGMELLSN